MRPPRYVLLAALCAMLPALCGPGGRVAARAAEPARDVKSGTATLAGDLTVEESGKSPDKKITVTSPGVYKAVVWQASGGGINEFYDLASDPDAKRNLGTAWGLFEVGWHGAALPKGVKPDPSKGDSDGSYGNRFWPTPPNDCKKLQAEGELDIVEKSSARVRVRAQSWFTFWSRYVDKNMPVTAYYTFCTSGQIAVQVRVQKMDRRFQWSAEYGPHLHVPASEKDPDADPAFIFSTPTVEAAKGGVFAPAEELVLATSAKLKTALMLTIPAEAHTLFDRHMRHNGRSVNWDRFGYGSNQVVMDPGYDNTWACLVQMGTQGHALVPPLRTAKDALPFALQYRSPAKIEGAELVNDDVGDFNKDGFNESEGCHVLKGPGPLAFSYERGAGAGFAPAFKVIGWKGEAPRTVKDDGKEVPVVAAVTGGNLVVQILGTLSGEKARIELAAGMKLKVSARTALSQLRVSGNHRYLEDASGQPFFLVGDCPQNLPLKLAVTEFDGYMADCQSKGFNWLWICIDGQNSGAPPPNPPVDRQGNRMMMAGWDIGTLNEKYFTTIDAIVKAANEHNQYCVFTPLSECQWSQTNINKNTAENWKKYGQFLGKRYKDAPNIVWTIGNDSINVKAQHAIVAGLKEAGDRHLMSVNWRPGVGEFGAAWVRKHKHGEKWIDLDAWYLNKRIGDGGSPAYWQKIEYERADPMPSFNTEAAYQKPDWHAATDLEIRMMNYSIALGGGCGGHVYGAGWLGDDYDYKTYKNNGGRVQTIHFKSLFADRDWMSLVPDYQHSFITKGYGTLSPSTTDYVGAAMNRGTLGMAYCPAPAKITADLSKFSGPLTARWYDPTNGKFQDSADSPFRNGGSHEFSTPGKNSTGDGDWVLVLEAAGKGYPVKLGLSTKPVSTAATVRVGAAQPRNRTIDFRLKPPDALAQVDKTLDELAILVHKAGAAGCDAIALPEDTLGLGKWKAANKGALQDVLPEAVKRMLDRLGGAAAKHGLYLVCCNDTLDPDGAVRNTAYFLGRDGKEIGRYHKVQPVIHEASKRGDQFPVFPTPDLGGVGMLICYDMVFPEAPRCLALGGADLIFHPTLGGAAIGDNDISRAAFRTRAVENFVYVVVSQRGGGSMIISPQGKILVEGKGPDDIAIADIDPFGGREGGDAFDHQHDMRARLFRERNPAAYGILSDPNPPVLKKVPATIAPEESARIASKAFTVGEDEFRQAAALASAGKTQEASAAFEKLRVEYKGTWIDRVAQERLRTLRQPVAKKDSGGRGLAAMYPGDVGIEKDPAVLFTDSFEGGMLAEVGWEKHGGFYDLKGSPKEMSITDKDAAVGKHSLELVHPKGVISPQWLHRTFPGQDTVFVRFYRKFEKDWVWAPMGIHDTILFAGKYNSPAATDLSLYLDISGVDQKVPARVAVRDTVLSKQPVLILRSAYQGPGLDFGLKKEIGTGEDFKWYYWLPDNVSPAPVLEGGRWYCFEYMAKLNSAPDKSDGEVRLWVDGTLVTAMTGLLLRNASHKDIQWDHWMLGPRYGGKDFKGGPPGEQRSWIDGIVVATKYVGPMQK